MKNNSNENKKNERLIQRFEEDVNKHMDVDTVKEGTSGLIFKNNYNDDEKANYFINHHIYWSKKLFFVGTVIFSINLLVLFILFIFIANRPENDFYITSPNGEIRKVEPINR